EDFRGDRKWREYLPYCDRFYFAVPEGFPGRLVPGDCGLIVADGYGGAIRRAATTMAVNGNRKRRQPQRRHRHDQHGHEIPTDHLPPPEHGLCSHGRTATARLLPHSSSLRSTPRSSYASAASLNLDSASESPGLRSGWCFIASRR
ncbi:MAG: MmcB family DNA repair protein, partial [Planctomycetes bacterium]|nr:MmcB family DNA repair protein [Planctomycetota bacterium]